MKQLLETDVFSRWFGRLADRRAKAVILARLRRVEMGHFGDCASVGEGVSELRVHHGPGYRVYYIERGLEVVVLLAGGSKGSQTRDIEKARRLAREMCRRESWAK